jgi:hypothetical protein
MLLPTLLGRYPIWCNDFKSSAYFNCHQVAETDSRLHQQHRYCIVDPKFVPWSSRCLKTLDPELRAKQAQSLLKGGTWGQKAKPWCSWSPGVIQGSAWLGSNSSASKLQLWLVGAKSVSHQIRPPVCPSPYQTGHPSSGLVSSSWPWGHSPHCAVAPCYFGKGFVLSPRSLLFPTLL